MTSIRFAIATLCAFLFVTAAPARAEIIEVSYTGTVTLVDTPLAGAFSLGDAVVGQFEFERPAGAPVFDVFNRARYAESLQSFSITVGSYSASATGGNVIVNDDVQAGSLAPVRDGFSASGSQGLSGAPIAGLNLVAMQFSLLSSVLSTLNSFAIPSTAELNALWMTNLADGNTNWLAFAGAEARYSLDSFSVISSIPEPQNYALLLAGLGLLGFAARRRQR